MLLFGNSFLIKKMNTYSIKLKEMKFQIKCWNMYILSHLPRAINVFFWH